MYNLKYQAHVAGQGWLDKVEEGQIAGTVGQSTQLEAFRVFLDTDDGSGINAFAKCNGMDWSDVNVSGQDTGTTGLGVAMEAFKIGLTGPMYETYDIWYNPHVSNIGWMGWAKNGEVVGTEGSQGDNRIEALQIRIEPKGKIWLGVDEVSSYMNVTPPAPVEEPEDSKRRRMVDRAASYSGYVSGTSQDSQFGRRYGFTGDWCCFFVNSVMDDEGLRYAYPFNGNGYCPGVVATAKAMGTWHPVGSYTPRSGDLVLYDFNYNGVADHIGIVDTVYSPTHILAWEGNTGSPVGVYRMNRPNGILGYVSPRF